MSSVVLSPVNTQVNPRSSPAIQLAVIVCIAKANSNGTTSVLYGSKLDEERSIEGDPFRLVKGSGLYCWPNDEVNNERIISGSVVEYEVFGDLMVYRKNTSKRMRIDEIQMKLEYGVNAYRSIKEACPEAILGERKGMYLKTQPEGPVTILVSITDGVIKNERIKFHTKGGETVDLKLNCRENLTLSTQPTHLKIRPLTADEDVGDVAVIKFDTTDIGLRSPIYAAVCEGLILRYKSTILSIEEEPVEIKNGKGIFILCPGVITLDTGNTIGTAISQTLLEELNLEGKIDNTKRVRYTAAGRNPDGSPLVGQSSKVKIKLKIRGRVFPIKALVNAAAPGVDLLIGMEVIGKLNDENFALGK